LDDGAEAGYKVTKRDGEQFDDGLGAHSVDSTIPNIQHYKNSTLFDA